MKKKRGAARLALTALAAALCLVWSGLGWGAPRAAAAESAAGQPYNIALLIDKSGYMNATDPERRGSAGGRRPPLRMRRKGGVGAACGRPPGSLPLDGGAVRRSRTEGVNGRERLSSLSFRAPPLSF